MVLFFVGLAVLVAGYFTYGAFVERVIAPDDRATPAVADPDGVDKVPLPKWKNMLIQLLNIAGIGPIIGVIAGIKFGRIAFAIIPIGCVLMGATHDFLGGMISIRMGGANLPAIVRKYLGKTYAAVFSWFMVVLLLLVVAVFINVPANLIDKNWMPETPFFWWAVAIIFAYYIVATLFPIDKIIGKLYPIFGALLLVGTIAIFVAITVAGIKDPSIFGESAQFLDFRDNVFNAGGKSPVFPLLFVTIACGIISGFHATQSPIVARTMKSEREARITFYGMMILEGLIAMIWAAAALAIYNDVTPVAGAEGLTVGMKNLKLAPAVVLGNITTKYLGAWLGGVTIFAVVVLAITSGDTALRSSRLSLAEMLRIDQVSLSKRIMVCVPLIVIVSVFLWWSNTSAESFGYIWNYFAWGNQVLSATTLMACTAWLVGKGLKAKSLIALLPGIFMTMVVSSFIVWTSADKGQPWGFGLPLAVSIAISAVVAIAFAVFAICRGRSVAKSEK